MKKTITACACLCLVALPGYVSAADEFVIDQNQPLSSVLLARLSQPDLWQTFEQSSNVISGAGVFLYPGEGDRGTVRIELWDGPPKATGGMKGDRVAFADAVGIANAWVDVFWTPVTSDPAATYFLVFEGMGQGNNLGLGGAQFMYSRGDAYIDGLPQPSFDYAFRTYGPAIPEPASASLLIAGLLTLVAARSVRRRTTTAG